MVWLQKQLRLPAMPRGFHLVTSTIMEGVPEISGIRMGWMQLFLQHTSASLTINENADPDVRADLESSISAIAPENFPYLHTVEGPDDMPAHVKSSLLSCCVTLPISDGRPALGTWQGIYLCEHRDRAGPRQLVVTIHGEPA